MSDARVPGKSEEERAALFEELMYLEKHQPVNKLAIVALIVGVCGGTLAPVFGWFAWAQINERNERGKALVIIGYAAFVVWVIVLMKVLADQALTP